MFNDSISPLICNSDYIQFYTKQSNTTNSEEETVKNATRFAVDARIERFYAMHLQVTNITVLQWGLSIRSLRLIDISGNHLQHVGTPQFWSRCYRLEYLFLHNNELKDCATLMEVLKPLPALWVLTLRGNPQLRYSRQSIVRSISSLLVLDDHLVSDVERLDWCSSFTIFPKFRPLSPSTFIGTRCLVSDATSAVVIDALLAKQLQRRFALASPAAQIQRIVRGWLARRWAVKERERKNRKPKSQSIMLPQPSDGLAMGTGARMFRGAADSLIVLKFAFAKWFHRRQAIAEALANAAMRSIVVRQSDIRFWNRMIHDLNSDAEPGAPSPCIFRNLEQYWMLRLHPHSLLQEKRDAPTPLILSSHTVIIKKPKSGIISQRGRPISLSCFNDSVCTTSSRDSFIRQAVTLSQSGKSGHKIPTTPLLLITFLSPEIMGKVVNSIYVYNGMRSCSPKVMTFYFSEDVYRISSAVIIQAFWRGLACRQKLSKRNKNLSIDPSTHILFRAKCFYVLRLQCYWRRIIARRRTRLLSVLRDAAVLVTMRAEGTSTVGFLSSNTLQQIFLLDATPRSFSFLPEQRAFVNGLQLLMSNQSQDGDQAGTVTEAIGVVLTGIQNFQCLPNYLRVALVPAAEWHSTSVGNILQLVLAGAQMDYFSYPGPSGLDTHVAEGIQYMTVKKEVEATSQQRRRHRSISLAKKTTSTSPEGMHRSSFKQPEKQYQYLQVPATVEVQRQTLAELVRKHPLGHLCLRYSDRKTSICRRHALIAHSYDFHQESFLCFEPRYLILEDTALVVLQRWYRYHRWHWRRVRREKEMVRVAEEERKAAIAAKHWQQQVELAEAGRKARENAVSKIIQTKLSIPGVKSIVSSQQQQPQVMMEYTSQAAVHQQTPVWKALFNEESTNIVEAAAPKPRRPQTARSSSKSGASCLRSSNVEEDQMVCGSKLKLISGTQKEVDSSSGIATEKRHRRTTVASAREKLRKELQELRGKRLAQRQDETKRSTSGSPRPLAGSKASLMLQTLEFTDGHGLVCPTELSGEVSRPSSIVSGVVELPSSCVRRIPTTPCNGPHIVAAETSSSVNPSRLCMLKTPENILAERTEWQRQMNQSRRDQHSGIVAQRSAVRSYAQQLENTQFKQQRSELKEKKVLIEKEQEEHLQFIRQRHCQWRQHHTEQQLRRMRSLAAMTSINHQQHLEAHAAKKEQLIRPKNTILSREGRPDSARVNHNVDATQWQDTNEVTPVRPISDGSAVNSLERMSPSSLNQWSTLGDL